MRLSHDKMNTESIAKAAQTCFEGCPTIILGSGASIPEGLPSMDELKNYLSVNLTTDREQEESAWHPVKTALEDGDHLEAALEGKFLPDSLLQKIVALTWKCVSEKDMALLYVAASNNREFPLGSLLSRMFNSTQSELHIVTTNYDRVAEYACNSVGVLFQTGFAPGYVQKWESTSRVNFFHGFKASRVVKIWKVHGSLDWFQIADEKTVGLPIFALPPAKYIPLIVTPGLNKYEKTHEDPFRTTINGADIALRKASAFLCVGFGFRDRHIHPKIVERCRESNVPIVVLARTLTDEAKEFLKNKAGTNYMGIEKANEGSKIYTPDNPCGLKVDDTDLWSLHGFNSLVL